MPKQQEGSSTGCARAQPAARLEPHTAPCPQQHGTREGIQPRSSWDRSTVHLCYFYTSEEQELSTLSQQSTGFARHVIRQRAHYWSPKGQAGPRACTAIMRAAPQGPAHPSPLRA